MIDNMKEYKREEHDSHNGNESGKGAKRVWRSSVDNTPSWSSSYNWAS